MPDHGGWFGDFLDASHHDVSDTDSQKDLSEIIGRATHPHDPAAYIRGAADGVAESKIEHLSEPSNERRRNASRDSGTTSNPASKRRKDRR